MSFAAFALSDDLDSTKGLRFGISCASPSQLAFSAFVKSISKWTLVHNTDMMSFGLRSLHTQEEARSFGFNSAFIENVS